MKKPISACLLSLMLGITVSSLAACQSQAPKSKPASPSAVTTGSSGMTSKERASVDKLEWLNTGDPEQDAQVMLMKAKNSNQKPVLLAFAGRGLSYPGLSKAEYEAIKSKVSYQVAEGSGDVTRGSADRAMRKKLKAYATIYNRTIVAGI